MAVGDALLAGFDPRSAAGMGTTYNTWLQNALGDSPLAYGFGQQMAPWQQLQYLSSPLARVNQSGIPSTPFAGVQRYGDIANPFLNWLGGGPADRVAVGSQTPLGEAGWMNRIQDIQAALSGGTGVPEALASQIQQRFGTANIGAEAAADYQRQLAFAPIIAGTSGALRGEIGSVLNNMYQNWLVNQGTNQGNFLKYAQRDWSDDPTQQGLWQQFGLVNKPLTTEQDQSSIS